MARSSYSSSGAGGGVVLRHRAAAAACACITVDAAAAEAHCTLEGAAQIRPADGFLHNHCRNSKGFYNRFFSNMVLPRCMECRRGLAMRILSVRLSHA